MAKLICKDGTEVKISDETEQELRKQFGPKPKFEPRRIHIGCFIVEIKEKHVCIRTDGGYPRHGCLQNPREVDQFIQALQDAKAFVEANS
jgi:hypothetical protein